MGRTNKSKSDKNGNIDDLERDQNIAILNREFDSLKAKLVNTNKFVQNFDSVLSSQQEVESRLSIFERTYDDYDSIVKQFTVQLDDVGFAELQESFDNFENNFHSTRANLKSLLTRSVKPSPEPTQIQNFNNPYLMPLPRIHVPVFDGNPLEWLTFKDTFTAVVHEHPHLHEVAKYTYLLEKLKGDARAAIGCITMSGNAYTRAWEELTKRYDNSRIIIEKHIEGLCNISQISKDSPTDLRALLNSCNSHISSLEVCGQQLTGLSELMVIHLVSKKLDINTRREWEDKLTVTELPTWQVLYEFLQKKCRVLEAIEVSKKPSTSFPTSKPLNKAQSSKPVQHSNTPHRSSSFLTSSSQNKQRQDSNQNQSNISKDTESLCCVMCKGENHPLFLCPDFVKLSPDDRYIKVKNFRFCINCFNPHHTVKYCVSIGCKICNYKHHTLLHRLQPNIRTNLQTSDLQQNTNTNSEPLNESNQPKANFSLQSKLLSKQIVLSTVIILIKDKNGRLHECRALLDSCSQSNFITDHLADKLGLHKMSMNELEIKGIEQIKTTVSQYSSASIQSKHSKYKRTLDFLIVSTISNSIPNKNLDISLWDIPSNIALSDPCFNLARPIDVLLSAEIFWNILILEPIRLGKNLPIIQNTLLGWIIGGEFENKNLHNFSLQCEQTNADDDLNQTVRQFREIETIPTKQFLSEEEKFCEKHFLENHFRDESGRFTVSLPLSAKADSLGDSKQQALKRFKYLENKLNLDSDLKRQYDSFMQEYIDLGHMKLITDPTEDPNKLYHYMPHHSILKPSITSTKLRVVFDASSKTTTNISLNDILHVGPNVQQNLFQIILRLRKYSYVFTADIIKMYRQINVVSSQTSLQRIFWRFDRKEEIKIYELSTVTYGTASAPYLATPSLKQLAIDEANNYPKGSAIALTDFYIDDILGGANTLEEALTLQQQLIGLLKKGGFKLHKWSSNNENLLRNIPIEDREELKLNDFSCDGSIKALGLVWKPNQDQLIFNIQPVASHKILTKRLVLSEIATVIIIAKLLIQSLWRSNSDWDDVLTENDHETWNYFTQTLTDINQICLQRCIMPENSLKVELHGFSDASEKAYGACVYIKTVDSQQNVFVNLVCSKSRVAPLKTISLPRLELCAALLLAKLTAIVIDTMKIDFGNIVLWSDSKITLCWIKTYPHKLKPFIANRVSEIQELTPNFSWCHIQSSDNSADIVSRGVMPDQLKSMQLWWNGPDFLNNIETRYVENPEMYDESKFSPEILELKSNQVTLVTLAEEPFDLLTRFSSYVKLQRVTAYILRFKYNSLNKYNKQNKKLDHLSIDELNLAQNTLVKLAQLFEFDLEIKCLSQNKELPKHSKIISLKPFLDNLGLIRVGGRIGKSNLNYDIKHQLLIPANHILTTMLFQYEHQRHFHAGPQLLLSLIRQRFGPLKGKITAKRTTRNCIVCAKAKPILSQQIMGDLPPERINRSKPFSTTGVDFCGPFFIKMKYQRRTAAQKVYVASFVCFVTKAIHLEIVSDLTSQAFIACLKRFISRRGNCITIWSDNAKNFIGADNELHRLYELFREQIEVDKINKFCVTEQINWRFIPARSPNFGGLWEASIKSLKTHLKRVTNDVHLTYEELNTLVIQIEGLLNSHPLTVMSNDPSDPEPLTPAHFLTGGPIRALCEPSYSEVPKNHLTNWQRISQMVESFWKRFSIEYVHSLQARHKCKRIVPNLQIGDIVLIADDNLPSTQWLFGRIINTIAGSDKHVRVVEVTTKNGIFKRAISKISRLPI